MKSKNMQRFICLLAGILLISASSVSFANSSLDDVKKETKELMQAIKGYSADQRDTMMEKTKSALDKMDRRIDELEKRIDKNWDQMKATARESSRANLKMLRKQRVLLAERYGSFKNSAGNAWEHMKKGFSDSYSAFHKAWEKAEKEFQPGK